MWKTQQTWYKINIILSLIRDGKGIILMAQGIVYYIYRATKDIRYKL